MSRRVQVGSSLLEGLVALAVFSFGLLGLAALQYQLAGLTAQTQLRAHATYLGEELTGLAMADVGNASCYTVANGAPGACGNERAAAALEAWLTRVQQTLPGTGTSPPTVSYEDSNGTFMVVLTWQRPHDAVRHNHTVVTNLYPAS